MLEIFIQLQLQIARKGVGRWEGGGRGCESEIFIYEMTQVPSLGIFACRQSIIGHKKQALKIQNKTILLQPNLT